MCLILVFLLPHFCRKIWLFIPLCFQSNWTWSLSTKKTSRQMLNKCYIFFFFLNFPWNLLTVRRLTVEWKSVRTCDLVRELTWLTRGRTIPTLSVCWRCCRRRAPFKHRRKFLPIVCHYQISIRYDYDLKCYLTQRAVPSLSVKSVGT